MVFWRRLWRSLVNRVMSVVMSVIRRVMSNRRPLRPQLPQVIPNTMAMEEGVQRDCRIVNSSEWKCFCQLTSVVVRRETSLISSLMISFVDLWYQIHSPTVQQDTSDTLDWSLWGIVTRLHQVRRPKSIKQLRLRNRYFTPLLWLPLLEWSFFSHFDLSCRARQKDETFSQ